MTTYGDMVTLILTFFILLYSFSNIDVLKFKKMLYSFRGAIGVVDGGKTFDEDNATFMGQSLQYGGSSRKQDIDITRVSQKIQSMIQEEGLEDQVKVAVNQRGVVISISEGLLFDPGQYHLLYQGKQVLDMVGMILLEIPNGISAEGHTDSVPVRGSSFLQDNWDLSALRASRVISYFADQIGIPSKRLQSIGYGDSRPLMPNDTVLHRQMNRRVDIVILS